VNDFGEDGFDSGPGEPRIFAINNPAPGDFSVQSVGTGDGPFTVHVYSIDLDKKFRDAHPQTSGITSPGSVRKHDFTLGSEARIAFMNRPPTADAGADSDRRRGRRRNRRGLSRRLALERPRRRRAHLHVGGSFGLASGRNRKSCCRPA